MRTPQEISRALDVSRHGADLAYAARDGEKCFLNAGAIAALAWVLQANIFGKDSGIPESQDIFSKALRDIENESLVKKQSIRHFPYPGEKP